MNAAPVTVARNAMATRFEIALFGDDPVALRAAADEALDEVQRVETMLNWRNPSSPLARLNARAALEPVRVNPELFDLLRRCQEFTRLAGGAFDITVGPLVRAWEAQANIGQAVNDPALADAREACGMHQVALDDASLTVRFQREGVRLEFGAIGKGYALELAAGILRDAGIASALIHGGTSTVCALGTPPGEPAWKVAVEYPAGSPANGPLPVLAVIGLRDASMSVSAVWGRVFRVGQNTFGHVLDPRTGAPADRALLSIYVSDNATETDALSTALLTEGPAGVDLLRQRRPQARTLVLARGSGGNLFDVVAHGIDWLPLDGGNSPVVGSTGVS
jgi:thiamine biosynthesis lipoprotein